MVDLFSTPAQLGALIASIQDAFYVVDAEGRVLFLNDALCQLTGFSRETLVAAGHAPPFAAVGAAEPLLDTLARLAKGPRGGGSANIVHVDGTKRTVQLSVSEVNDATGSRVAFCVTMKDLDEGARVAAVAREAEQRWRSIAENPFDFVVVIDRSYRYTFVNHAAPGIDIDTLLGRATPFDFVEPEYHSTMRAAFDTTFETGRATSYEVYVPQLDAWYGSVVGPIREGAHVTSLSILTRDITQQKRTLEALSAERVRIARDLHDHLGASLSGIALRAEREQKQVLAESRLALAWIQDTARFCLEELRDTIRVLGDDMLPSQDLLATLRRRAEDNVVGTGVSLQWNVQGHWQEPLDPGVSVALSAILREALTNVLRHSGATLVRINLARDATELRLEISDNGAGLAPGFREGNGLPNMHARAQEQGGGVSIGPNAPCGVQVTASFPLRKSSK